MSGIEMDRSAVFWWKLSHLPLMGFFLYTDYDASLMVVN